ncbi:MAG: ferritin family protein [Pseudomonadota bacterium]
MDKLELEKIFSIAINREIESHEFYKDVAAKAQNPNVKKVFEELASEEMGHMELLEKFKEDPTRLMSFKSAPQDFKVAEATDLPKLTLDMQPADAIALAMKKEQQAVEFYRDLSKHCSSPETCNIFENLANMELTHKQKLEKVFVEIGYPEAF